jgi:hypothetical protein
MNYLQKKKFGNYKIKIAFAVWVSLILVVFNLPYPNVASDTSSPLSKTQQSSAKRGNSYAGSGKADKAQTSYQSAIDQATSVDQCLALVKATEHFGSILLPVRRNCLTKALSLAKTDDEYFQVILAARQCQVYEVTKQCIDALIARSQTEDALLALAHKSLSMAIEDVAHIAMEKLYMLISSNPPNAEASLQSSPLQPYQKKLAFAEQAKLMAMEDLMRKAVKDMLDQEQSAHGLCALATAIEPLELPDLQRKFLRKAVYQVGSVEDCKEVYEMGRRLGQQDIVDLAGYKGRKMILIEQANAEQQAIKDQQEAIKEEQELKQAEETGQSPPSTSSQQANQQGKKASPSGPGF